MTLTPIEKEHIYPADTMTYRCNACGHKHTEPAFCEHCGTPLCPKCERAGCITNLTEMHRATSQRAELRSQMKRSRTPNKKPKTKQQIEDRKAILIARLEE